jgi:hypothetical protein
MRLAYYGDSLSPNITQTPEGFLICKNVPIGRTGDMEYTRAELNLEGDPTEMVIVHRDEKDVFDPATIASFEGKAVTDNHPHEDVMPDNYANYGKGHIQNVRRGTGENNDRLVADLFVTDPTLINEILNKVRREVSCGYDCKFPPNEDGTYSQRQIRGNHVAVVSDGRAGDSVCIKDSVPTHSLETLENNSRKERISMKNSRKKAKTNPILSLFAKSVRDAKDSNEVEEIIEEVTEIFDCEGKDEENTTPATDSGSEKAADGVLTADDVEKMIDSAVSKAIETVMDAMSPKKSEDEDPDDLIKGLIEELTEDKDVDDEDVDDNSEQEDALTVEAGSMDGEETEDSDNSELKAVAHDTAIQILKSARPAIAKIKDKAERKRVTDALISSVRSQTGSKQMSSIMKTAAKVAQKQARDSAIGKGVDLEAVQKAYDSRNPHKKGDS